MSDSAAAVLFSKTRQAVLTAFLENPGQQRYLRDIERETGLSTGALQNELRQLHRADLIVRVRDGNRVNYQANTRHPAFEDLRRLVLKTCGTPALLRHSLQAAEPDIRFAAIYGSMAKGSSHAASDVDLLVVGTVSLPALIKIVSPVEEQIGREIGVRLYTPEEFRQRRQAPGFLKTVLDGQLIPVIGTADDA